MQKPYGKLVRDEFERRLKTLFPFAHRVPKPGQYYWPDERVYRIDDKNSERSIAIIYSPHPNGSNAFTVEIGWAPLNEIPALDHRPSLETPEQAIQLSLIQAVFRLGSLAEPKWDFLKITDELEFDPEMTVEKKQKILNLLDIAFRELYSTTTKFLRDPQSS